MQEYAEKEIIYAFFSFFKKNKIILFLAVLTGGFMGLLKATLKPLYYESKAVVFSVNTTENDKAGGSSPFGIELHADQLIQVLKSDIIMDSVRKYCDPGGKKGFSNVFLSQTIRFYRTPHLGIEITARTEKPEDAYCIVSHLIAHTHDAYNAIIRQATLPQRDNALEEYLKHQEEWEMLTDSIESLPLGALASRNRLNLLAENKQKKVMELLSKYETLRHKADKEFVPLFVLNKPQLSQNPIPAGYFPNIIAGMLLTLIIVIAGLILYIQSQCFVSKTN